MGDKTGIAEVILDYTESLFKLEGDKVQKLGTIPPNIPRTVTFLLKPLGCVHNENLGAIIHYRDHTWEKHVVTMRPKEVHCVCPFLKEKVMTRGEFLELSKSGHTAETGLNFQGIGADQLTSFLEQICKNRQYKVDEYSIEGGKMLLLASESIGEKAIYLLTAYIRENEGLTQVMLRAVSDKSYGLNGFLNEIVDGLRHIVSTVQSAQEIGVIKKEQVINIIDSVVQRTSFGGSGGEGAASVNIRDSVVQRIKFGDGDDTPKIEQSSIENGVEIGYFTFDLKFFKPRLDKNSDYENTSGNAAAFGGKKWTKGTPSMFVETPYGFLGISKTGVERGVAKKLENAVQMDEITESGNIEPQLPEKESKKRENIENLHEEDLQNDGVSRDSKKQEPLINQKRKNRKNNFVLAIVFVILVFGLWSFGSDSNDVQNIPPLSSQPEGVPESTEPTSSVQPDVAAEVSQTPAPSSNQKTLTNSIGMEFVLIPAGEFDMGSPSNEEGRFDDEGPVHSVTISNDFYMGKYEVTQKQWIEVMGDNPSQFRGDNLPVEHLSWYDVQEFIRKLNKMEGTYKYRLPSEAEWEYACRAGTTTRYSFGDSESNLGEYAWYDSNSGGKTHPVGQKNPNPWGLYDMHGNVWEWVQDKNYGSYYDAPVDGSAYEDGDSPIRVLCGSGCLMNANSCRSASRMAIIPNSHFESLGFRLLMEL